MRTILIMALVWLGGCTALAQTTPADAGQAISLEPDTQIAAQLQSTLDVRKAKIGDPVVLKTTEAIKSGKQTIVKKGIRLVGRVTEVQQKSEDRGESHISLVFERLDTSPIAVLITALINNITPPQTQARNVEEDLPSASSGTRGGAIMRSQDPQRAATNTGSGMTGGGVGSRVNVLDAAAGGVDSSGRSIGAIRISQSTDANAEGSLTLSLAGANLRLEKGTTFRLTINQATGGGAPQ